MIFSGKAIEVSIDDSGIATLCFDLKDESVNKLNELTRKELKECVAIIKSSSDIKALMITSGKPVFIVGADITEFTDNFTQPVEEFIADLTEVNETIFNEIEDLNMPTITCINGMALGGGLETALTTDYRVMSTIAKIGLPETGLGILPGYGGTVRLSRVIGAGNALDWICSAKHFGAQDALKVGAVDSIVAPEDLKDAAMTMLQQCLDGKLDYLSKRKEKLEPLKLNENEATMTFSSARDKVSKQSGTDYPAPMKAIDVIEQAARLGREEALKIESEANGNLSRSLVAKHLIGLFIGDQALVKSAKVRAKTAKPISKSAVLGAGIMGGGIAYQTALKGMPIIMKDIAQEGIDLGLNEASKLLSKRVNRGQMKPEKMAEVLNRIKPSLNLDGFDSVDIVVEAVVENIKVKQAVLTEVESTLSDSAVLTSNTSTISITQLATALKKPENFCGMHFFNPVPIMPLVEVIRGEKTSDETVARVCNYALALGKKPVVVNDCPGFLINRILSPYFMAFVTLSKRGVDHVRIDKVMEKFGWPMGPAHLIDVIGIDTLNHGMDVLAEGYPDRMHMNFTTSHDVMVEAGRFGQKNGQGYYKYEADKRGRMKKVVDPVAAELLKNNADDHIEITDEEIVGLMMLSMCLEAVRALDDGIVATPTELDMSLIYAIGFPRFRGGALRYLDAMGIKECIELAEKFQELGGAYAVPESLRLKLNSGESFYS